MRYNPARQLETSDRITAMIERATMVEERYFLTEQSPKRRNAAADPVFYEDDCKKFS